MRYQPQGGARLNTGNPLARGLIAVFVGSQAVDPITGKPFVNSAPGNRVAGVMGIGLNARTGQAKVAAAGPSLANGSMFALFSSTDSNTEQIVMEVGPDGTFSGGVRGLRIYQGRLTTYVRNFTEVGGGGTYDISKPTAMGATYSDTAASLYVNGKLDASGTTSSTTSPASIFNVGGITGDTNYSLRGSVGVAFVWSRTLSAAEMASLANNPWQMFAAPYEEGEAGSAGIDSDATPEGVTAFVWTGSASASAGARGRPLGVGSTANVGSATAAAGSGANPAASGVSAAGLVGLPVAVAGARVSPAGVGSTASLGLPSAVGGALIVSTGVNASARVGLATAVGGNASTAAPPGIVATASIGAAQVAAGSRAAPPGVSASASVGALTASTGANSIASAVGVSAAANVGTVVGAGSAGCTPAGVTTAASVGDIIAAGNIAMPGRASPMAAAAHAQVGIATATGHRSAIALSAGVTAYARAGTGMASGQGAFTRAPNGPGYTSHQHYNERRPSAIQRNNR